MIYVGSLLNVINEENKVNKVRKGYDTLGDTVGKGTEFLGNVLGNIHGATIGQIPFLGKATQGFNKGYTRGYDNGDEVVHKYIRKPIGKKIGAYD